LKVVDFICFGVGVQLKDYFSFERRTSPYSNKAI
jgi:hypothetical protein